MTEPATETVPDEPEAGPPRSRSWWRIALAVLALVVALWIWLTRWSTLLASHPAYPVVVTLVGAVAILALLSGARLRDRRPRKGWVVIALRAVTLVVLVALLAALVWLRPFAASAKARDAMGARSPVRVSSSATRITLTPTAAKRPATGLVFYPGARVDPRAYVPLLRRISARGTLIVIVKAPLDIALLSPGAAGGVIGDHPEVREWATGGHSLGGVAASSYAAAHRKQVKALLLWASYPVKDLSKRDDLLVASISGTQDALATPADIAESRTKLPRATTFVPVDGGVHAYFGDYGAQPGDGTATISRPRAQTQIVASSVDLMTDLANLADLR